MIDGDDGIGRVRRYTADIMTKLVMPRTQVTVEIGAVEHWSPSNEFRSNLLSIMSDAEGKIRELIKAELEGS